MYIYALFVSNLTILTFSKVMYLCEGAYEWATVRARGA